MKACQNDKQTNKMRGWGQRIAHVESRVHFGEAKKMAIKSNVGGKTIWALGLVSIFNVVAWFFSTWQGLLSEKMV